MTLTHKDVEMHGCALKSNDPEYFPYTAYYKWTKRTYFFKGFKVWSRRINFRECDPYELIN